MSVSFQDPETDIMDQFLGPETDIMGERNFMADGRILDRDHSVLFDNLTEEESNKFAIDLKTLFYC